jgi:hypothetical protein
VSARAPRRRIRLEDLLGARVRTAERDVVGRIEEVRAVRRAGEYEISEYHLGPAALLERLALVSRIFGGGRRTIIVRWDQVDVSDPRAPVLTCDRDQLKQARR